MQSDQYFLWYYRFTNLGVYENGLILRIKMGVEVIFSVISYGSSGSATGSGAVS